MPDAFSYLLFQNTQINHIFNLFIELLFVLFTWYFNQMNLITSHIYRVLNANTTEFNESCVLL